MIINYNKQTSSNVRGNTLDDDLKPEIEKVVQKTSLRDLYEPFVC